MTMKQEAPQTMPSHYGLALFCLVWLVPDTSHAYIGPGAGISAIGSLLALLAAILLAIVGFIWYPLKGFMKKRSKKGYSKPGDAKGEST
ncbi:MAG: hypothetical protein ACR2QH_06995 [Geminicoccaceae bacterium]